MSDTNGFLGLNVAAIVWYAAAFIGGLYLWYRWRGFASTRDVVVSMICFGVLPYLALFLFFLVRVPSRLHEQQALEIKALKARIEDERKKYDLAGTISRLIIGRSSATEIFVLMYVEVRNAGQSPSVLTTWRLDNAALRLSNIVASRITDDTKLMNDQGTQTGMINEEDAIYVKGTSPIPVGGLVEGWVLFVFRNVERAVADEHRGDFILSFEDVTSRKHQIKYQVATETNQRRYIPGADKPRK